MIGAVVFDVGGVLTEDPVAQMAALDRECGLPVGTMESFFRGGAEFAEVETGTSSVRESLKRLGQRVHDEHGVRVELRRVAEALGASQRPRPEMRRLATDVKAAGYVVALLTNMVAEAREWLSSLLPPGSVDVLVDSSEVGLRKPDPRIYQHLLARLDLPAGEVAYIDDFEENLRPARALGITAIHFRGPARARRELVAAGVAVSGTAATTVGGE